MPLKLPATSSPLRELFDLADLANVEALFKLPTLRQAVAKAGVMFSADRSVRQINMLVIRADGSLHLMQFGPRGGKRTLWDFGKL